MKQMSLNMIPLIMSHAQDETLAYCGVDPFSQAIRRMPKDGFHQNPQSHYQGKHFKQQQPTFISEGRNG